MSHRAGAQNGLKNSAREALYELSKELESLVSKKRKRRPSSLPDSPSAKTETAENTTATPAVKKRKAKKQKQPLQASNAGQPTELAIEDGIGSKAEHTATVANSDRDLEKPANEPQSAAVSSKKADKETLARKAEAEGSASPAELKVLELASAERGKAAAGLPEVKTKKSKRKGGGANDAVSRAAGRTLAVLGKTSSSLLFNWKDQTR